MSFYPFPFLLSLCDFLSPLSSIYFLFVYFSFQLHIFSHRPSNLLPNTLQRSFTQCLHLRKRQRNNVLEVAKRRSVRPAPRRSNHFVVLHGSQLGRRQWRRILERQPKRPVDVVRRTRAQGNQHRRVVHVLPRPSRRSRLNVPATRSADARQPRRRRNNARTPESQPTVTRNLSRTADVS